MLPIAPEFDLSNLSTVLKESVDPYVLDWDRREYCPVEIFQKLHDLGIFAAPYPKEFGGAGLKMIDLLGIASELAYHSPAIFSGWIGSMLAQTALYRFGSQELTKWVCRAQLKKRSLMSFCATEHETGTDVLAAHTVAISVEGGYRLTGKKHFITNINYAADLIVFAKVKRPDGTFEEGITAFYVPATVQGVEVGEPLKKLGQREGNTGRVSFTDVFVPEAHRLGEEGQGYPILSTCISRTKTLICGASVGICRRAEDEAMAYLKGTIRYGSPLLKKKEIQTVLTSMRARMEAAWLLGCRAGAVWDEKGNAVYEASLAKFFCADMAVGFVNEAVELTGATGYMQESFLSKLYRDVKLLEIYEGSTLVQQALFGKEMFTPVWKGASSSIKKAA